MGNAVCLQPTIPIHTSAMCGQYIAENRRNYFPIPSKVPHPNSIKTPDDYPKEKKRLTILAEKKRAKDEKKGKVLVIEDIASASKPKKRRLRRTLASPLPSHTDEDRAHVAAVDAAAAAHLEDSIHGDPSADADNESEHTPIAPAPKRQKLRMSLNKPGEKPPASRGVKLQDPAD